MAATIIKNGLDVQIIQTKFTFLAKTLNPFQKNIMNSIRKRYNFNRKEQIKPMSGWVHGFDLALLFLHSMNSIESKTKANLKKELESLRKPVQGLIKIYKNPFQAYSPSNINAHEALLPEDYIMRRFDIDGNLR